MKKPSNWVQHGYSDISVKRVRIRSFSGQYFPTFGLNTEIYSINLCIQSKWEKIRTRKVPNTATFHAVIVILVNFTVQKVARFMWFVVILKLKAEIKNVMNTFSIYQKLSSLLREIFPDFFSTREPILFTPNVVWWYHWTNPNTDDLISAFQEESF